MDVLTVTLVADGSSDRVLVPMVEFLLDSHSPWPYQTQFALELPPAGSGLRARIEHAIANFPCQLLVVHRDAESGEPDDRLAEIAAAVDSRHGCLKWVALVPVRMTEAWLLIDVAAIRRAAGNPAGRAPLDVPKASRLESLADPKRVLKDALNDASNLGARRRLDFNQARQRVGEVLSYDLLRQLPSFQSFEVRMKESLQSLRSLRGT